MYRGPVPNPPKPVQLAVVVSAAALVGIQQVVTDKGVGEKKLGSDQDSVLVRQCVCPDAVALLANS